jgi:hypothetical protein
MTSYLDAIGEEYTFYDLAVEDKDIRQKYKKEVFAYFDKTETPLIPVTLIDDNPKIVGFDTPQIDKINEYLAKRN